jgi:hypothetical protein
MCLHPEHKLMGQLGALKYNPNQPRDPGGEHGGQWTSGGGGSWEFPDDEFRNDQEAIAAPEDWGLTDQEIASVAGYTRGGYKTVNESLRDGVEPPTETGKRLMADLDSVIAKAGELPEPRTVWRGVDMGYVGIPTGPGEAIRPRDEREARTYEGLADWAEATFKPGQQVELPAFQSTSAYVSPPLNAAVSSKAPGVIFEIRAHNGAPISTLSGFDDEGELLLPRGSRYRVRKVLRRVEFVQSIDASADRTVVQLEQI